MSVDWSWCPHVIHIHMNAIKWLGLNLACLRDCGDREPLMICRCGIHYNIGVYYVSNMKEKFIM